MNLKELATRLYGMSKGRLFAVFIGVAVVVATVVSLVTWATFLKQSSNHAWRLIVQAPRTGPEKPHGDALVRGVELFVQQINQAGGVANRPLQIVYLDERGDPGEITRLLESNREEGNIIGVLGHWSAKTAQARIPLYAGQHLPTLLLSTAPQGYFVPNEWIFHLVPDETFELRFLANYVRNVIGEKSVFLIHEAGERGERLAAAWEEVYQRFGTKTLFKWSYTPGSPRLDEEMKGVLAEVQEKKLFGTYLVLGDTEDGARVVAALRKGGIRQRVVGLHSLADNAFVHAFGQLWQGRGSVASALNGMLVTTPLLYDTAGEAAQSFRHAYYGRNAEWPDWIAAHSHDAAGLLVSTFKKILRQHGNATNSELMDRMREALAGMNRIDAAYPGIVGPIFFDDKGRAVRSVMTGQYDGGNLVAAHSQLSPIHDEGVGNFLEEVTAGRALYVNDRFMYKTNVIYTGIRIEKVLSLDLAANTAEIDFSLWFRWRGDSDPSNVVFTNAAAPLQLPAPQKEGKDGELNYRAYRVKGKFFLNYSNAVRNYGTQIAGISFRHRLLNHNNLMYVNDVLGENQDEAIPPSVMSTREVLDADADTQATHRDPLVNQLIRSKVLAGLNGWLIDRAWVSQERAMQNSEGNPLFVGFGKPQPVFSQMEAAILLKPDQLELRDFLPPGDAYVFLGIFAFVGSLLAKFLDRKDHGQFWRIQTFFLRLVCWPSLLAVLGNLARDYALRHYTTTTVDNIVLVFDLLWWLVPAHLVVISLEHFLWTPLENRTSRKIPNVVRFFSAGLVYLIAIFAVVAFVMGKTITSLLATSGMMAMIMGLAVQGNLRDVFSGIVLNIERPFSIGDFVKIGNVVGQVTDITWRTIRILANDGQSVSFPNGKTADAEIHNLSRARCVNTGCSVYVNPAYEPAAILKIINETLPKVKGFVRDLPEDEPAAYFIGVENLLGHWVGHYKVSFAVRIMPKKNKAVQELWQMLWYGFRENGITWVNIDGEEINPATLIATSAKK
ncbi:MAG: ABC transporter substrate-binding protein [Magnetococcales bacterium]|nr:ABC transporter substrate-binding protein [Magnetococcales bacterium]